MIIIIRQYYIRVRKILFTQSKHFMVGKIHKKGMIAVMKYKKFLAIGLSLTVFIILLYANFKGIEEENEHLLSSKMQFKGIFYTNFELFENVAKKSKNCDNLIVHYNPNVGFEQLDNINNELASEIWSLTQYCGVNEIYKFENSLIIYQYHPVSSGDIKIGARYYYENNFWEYYYEHDYKDCRHKHKLFYFLYDFLFNKGSL